MRNEDLLCESDFLSTFLAVLVEVVAAMMSHLLCKHCSLDPVPTWLIKKSVNLLAPFIILLVRKSLSQGYEPLSQKVVTAPRLKKGDLDPNATSSNRLLVSNSVIPIRGLNMQFIIS